MLCKNYLYFLCVCKLQLIFSSQDCVAGLYQSLGMSVGAEFSCEDVSLLFHKVFHVPSNTDEAHTAMKKVTTETTNITITAVIIFVYRNGIVLVCVPLSVSDCWR